METLGLTLDRRFWSGKRVLVTGHTGFKGAWLCLLLDHFGANVSGLALAAEPGGAFDAMRPAVDTNSIDVRSVADVAAAVRAADPEIVLHLAAQALVGTGHQHPLATFATNVMGTVHVLDALQSSRARVALIVTSDKVYRPTPDTPPFNEAHPLGGTDPYSASKVAAEQAAAAWRPRLAHCRVATARAGNVIGGGDLGAGRLAVDVIRAYRSGETLRLRRPESVRPWQYVLDVLSGYLLYAQALWNGDAPTALNFGPQDNGAMGDGAMGDGAIDRGSIDDGAITAAGLAERLQRALGSPAGWCRGEIPFAETLSLRLDASLAARTLGWRTSTPIAQALDWTAAWHQAVWRKQDMRATGHSLIEAWMHA